MSRTGLVRGARWAARLVVLFGWTVLASWALVPSGLTVVGVGGHTPTKPGTAVALVLIGVATAWRLAPGLRRALLAGSLVVSGEALVAWLTDRHLISGELLFPRVWATAAPDGHGQMAVGAALGLASAGLGLLVHRARPRLGTGLGVLTFALGYVAFLGHLYGVDELHSLDSATSLAPTTSLAMMLLGAVVTAPTESAPAVRLVTTPGIAGALVRSLLPWAVLAPPAVGLAVHAMQRRDWFSSSFGLTLTVLVFALSLCAAVVAGARTAARTDRERESVAADLSALNSVLSERVAAAVADAESGRDRLQYLLDSTRVGIFESDPDGRRRFVNQGWRDISGLDGDVTGADWIAVVHPDDRERVAEAWARAIGDGVEFTHRCRYLRPDGGVSWVDLNARTVRDQSGEVVRWLGTVTDVTSQVAAQEQLAASERRFRTAMEHAPIGMALVELDGRFREVNRALCRIVGYDEDDLVGSTFQQITHPEDLESDLDNVGRLLDGTLDHYSMEKRYLTRAGEVVWVLLAVSLSRDEHDRPAYFVSQIQDITDARAARQKLAHRALHDPLTGLPNRDLLMDHLAHAILRSGRSEGLTAVMFCDLDRFKEVNDTYGHDVGDQLLMTVADRLRAEMRPGDTVARLGGDEFVVVAVALPDVRAVRALAERVRRSLDQPVPFGFGVVTAYASIGVAVAGPEDDARSLLREADAAMYRAKTLGRGRVEVSHPA